MVLNSVLTVYGCLLPARVVQWLSHLGAMCSRVWHAHWRQYGVQSGYSVLPYPSVMHTHH